MRERERETETDRDRWRTRERKREGKKEERVCHRGRLVGGRWKWEIVGRNEHWWREGCQNII